MQYIWPVYFTSFVSKIVYKLKLFNNTEMIELFTQVNIIH
jgi:hypothetical protein